MTSIFEMLKIASIEDDFVLTSLMRRFSIWELSGLESEFRHFDFSQIYSAFDRELTENSVVEFFRISKCRDERVEYKARNEKNPVLRQRLNFLNSLGVKTNRNFLCVTTDPPKKRFPLAGFSFKTHAEIVDSIGSKFRQLKTDEIKELLYGLLSFDSERLIHPEMSVREELLQHQCSATPAFFKIGKTFCKVLSLKLLPESTDPFMTSEALDTLPLDFVFSVSFQTLPQSREWLSLEAKERFYIATSGRGAAKNAADADSLMNSLTKTRRKIGFLSSKIILWSQSPAGLEENTEKIVNILKGDGFCYEEETFEHDLEFFKSIPTQMAVSERQHRVLSPNFIDILPLSRHNHGNTEAPYPLYLRNRCGELYGFDAGSNLRNNKNGSIFGCSGSGKSVTVNMLISHTFFPNIKQDVSHPGRIFIVDFAGAENSSYLKAAKLYGGTFIPIDSSGSVVINPFPPRSSVLQKGEWNPSLLSFLGAVLDLILEIRGTDMDAGLFRNIVSRAVRSMYQKREFPVLSDLLDFIDDFDQEKCEVIKKLLRGFIDDPVSRSINGRSTVKYSEEPFVIYDLQGINTLSQKLKELFTFIVIQEAKKTAFEVTNSFILFDEAAQLIKNPALGDLIEELFATARKYNTGIWTITQNYLSFKEASLSSKIKINTTTTVFLNHAGDEEARQLVSGDFGLSEAERRVFNSLKTVKGRYAEALFRTQIGSELQSEAVRIELSPFDYAIATSDKEENRLLETLAAKCGLSRVEACASAAIFAQKNGLFVIDAVRKMLEMKQ